MPAPAVPERLPQTTRVWFTETPLTNWTIVRTPRGLVLIDAGYTAQVDQVLASVDAVAAGEPGLELVAILVTHAHTDHIGTIPEILRQRPGIEVLAAPAEVDAVRGPVREQIEVANMGEDLKRPKFRAWLNAGIEAGGLGEVSIPSARAFTNDELTEFGIIAHAAPGHTPGSTVYEIVGENTLVTGDAFITDHPSYDTPRVGAIDAAFSADDALALESAAHISREAMILPGHGPALPPQSSRL